MAKTPIKARTDTAWGVGNATDLTQTLRGTTLVNSSYVAGQAWFGPLTPPAPMAPQTPEAGVVGRRFDYTPGYNLNQRPRSYEPVSFADLRGLARSCDVMRMVIETRKDQMASLDWIVRIKAMPGEDKRRLKATPEQQNRIKKITEFMQCPDPYMGWDFDTWTRAFMEDHFVIDAPFVYKRPNRASQIGAFELIAGDTIIPLLSADGRRPIAPDPAYEQINKGIVAANYSADQCYYAARNVATNRVYGYSPVEQVLVTANIAIRRQIHQLNYYTDGSQPDAFLSVPDTWDMNQIKDFQKHLDSLKQQRRKLRVVGGQFKYEPTKDPVLKDEYDDYLTRLICFAFSVTPAALTKMMNRATSQSSHDQALEEGNGPTMRWYSQWWSRVIATDFASPDLEMEYVDNQVVDPATQATVDSSYVKTGIYTIDEVRESRGKEPLGGAASLPMVETATGFMTIGANVPTEKGGDQEPGPTPAEIAANAVATHQAKQGLPGAQPDAQPAAQPGADKTGTKGAKGAKAAAKLSKAQKAGVKYLAPASAKRKTTTAAKAALTTKIAKVLANTGRHVAQQLRTMVKDAPVDADAQTDKLLRQIDLSSLALAATATVEEAQQIATESGLEALARLGVADRDALVGQVNKGAVQYAKDRAAYLVGKSFDADGALIDNPRAEYAITEATRDMLRSLITDYLAQAKPMPELADAIEAEFAFSQARAKMIAATEVGTANSQGALIGYKAAQSAGLTVYKVWSVNGLDTCCDECEENEEAGPIALDDLFPSGDECPLAHPNCQCVLLSAIDDGSGNTEETED